MPLHIPTERESETRSAHPERRRSCTAPARRAPSSILGRGHAHIHLPTQSQTVQATISIHPLFSLIQNRSRLHIPTHVRVSLLPRHGRHLPKQTLPTICGLCVYWLLEGSSRLLVLQPVDTEGHHLTSRLLRRRCLPVPIGAIRYLTERLRVQSVETGS